MLANTEIGVAPSISEGWTEVVNAVLYTRLYPVIQTLCPETPGIVSVARVVEVVEKIPVEAGALVSVRNPTPFYST